jgi:hypothetical protein
MGPDLGMVNIPSWYVPQELIPTISNLAVQLLEKRSAIHSGRPENMFVDMSVEGIV